MRIWLSLTILSLFLQHACFRYFRVYNKTRIFKDIKLVLGGVSGYGNFLDVINDVEDEEHEHMLEWIGGGFDPEYFNAQEVSFDNPDERWSIVRSIPPVM